MKRFFSFFIFSFFAIPTLISVIYFIGIIKAITNPLFYQQVANKIIKNLPITADALLKSSANLPLAEKEKVFGENLFLLEAFSKNETSLNDLFFQIKLNSYLEKETNSAFEKINSYYQEPIYFDNQLLKESLNTINFNQYLLTTINNLPKCSSQQKQKYLDIFLNNSQTKSSNIVLNPLSKDNLCQMDEKINPLIAQKAQEIIVNSIPEKTLIFNSEQLISFYKLKKYNNFLIYFLFLIPIIFFIIGGFLFSTQKILILRSISVAIFISGLISALISKFLISFLVKFPVMFNNVNLTSELNNTTQIEQFASLIKYFLVDLINILFNPIIKISFSIMVSSIVLFCLSFFLKKTNNA